MKLEISNICFGYKSTPVLDSITMSVTSGEVVALVGPNGSGKTTLLKCIARMLKPKGGSIIIEGQNLDKVGPKDIAKLMGYVPQSATNVFPCTVFDAVLIGRRPYLTWGVGKEDRRIISQTLGVMGLQHMAERPFNEISAGEQQKVLIARALAQEPQVLLLDEPTSNLDLRHQLEVLSTLQKATKERRISAIIAIHDLNLASRFSDKIVFLKDRHIYDAGEPRAVLTVDNVRSVYGVEVVINDNSGWPHVMAIGPV